MTLPVNFQPRILIPRVLIAAGLVLCGSVLRADSLAVNGALAVNTAISHTK